MKIRLVGAELLQHEDRQTDRQTDGRTYTTKLVVAFITFANAPKNRSVNDAYGNDSCLFWYPHETHKYTVWA